MPQARKLNPARLMLWDTEGLSAVDMQRRLADEGTMASLDLVRLRLREARRNAQGEPPAPKPQRKSSATNRRQTQLAEASPWWRHSRRPGERPGGLGRQLRRQRALREVHGGGRIAGIGSRGPGISRCFLG